MQRGSVNRRAGYSDKAQFTGKPAYLEPFSDSLQEPEEGSTQSFSPLNKGGGSSFRAQQFTQLHKNPHQQPTLATLIPKDDILIFCETASKTALAKYAKPSKHATPCSHEHGVKGEPNRKQSGFRMTPRTNNSDAHTYERFSPNANGHHQRPDMPRRLENGSA
jgi:hypothetical protein